MPASVAVGDIACAKEHGEKFFLRPAGNADARVSHGNGHSTLALGETDDDFAFLTVVFHGIGHDIVQHMVNILPVQPHDRLLFRQDEADCYLLFYQQRTERLHHFFQIGPEVATGHFHPLAPHRVEVEFLEIQQFGGESVQPLRADEGKGEESAVVGGQLPVLVQVVQRTHDEGHRCAYVMRDVDEKS